MKKQILSYILTCTLSIAFLCGCSFRGQEETPPLEKAQEPSVADAPVQNEQADIKENVMYEITETDLFIPSGDNEIYGRLYLPVTDEPCPAVILAHGYNGSYSDFTSSCEYCARNGYIAFAYDFCGGSTDSRSSGRTEDMTISSEKSDCIAVFEAISARNDVISDQIFVMGASQGGLASALAVEELGNRPAGMILFFPAFCIPDDWRENFPEGTVIPDTFDFWGMTLGKDYFTEMMDLYVFDVIGRYSGPVIIFHGDMDTIVPLSYSEEAVKLYPNASLVVMSGEGHGFSVAGNASATEQALAFMKEEP